MGFYIQLDEDYFGHPKVLQLKTLIGPEADVYMPRLWCYAVKYVKEGTFRHPSQIESAAMWYGEPGALIKALVECGFIEPDGLTLHGWMDRTGGALETYGLHKQKVREYYKKKKGEPTNGQQEKPTPKGGPYLLLAKQWNTTGTGFPINEASGEDIIQKYIFRGAPPQEVEKLMWDAERCRGKKIWEALETLCPKNGKPLSMDEQVKAKLRREAK